MIMYRLLGVCVLNNISNLTQIKIQIIHKKESSLMEGTKVPPRYTTQLKY